MLKELLLAFGLAGTPSADAEPRNYTVGLTGDEGTQFAGECRARVGDEWEGLSLVGTVPLRQSFAASELRCELMLTNDGRLTVEITSSHGGRMRSSTTRMGNRIRMNVR